MHYRDRRTWRDVSPKLLRRHWHAEHFAQQLHLWAID
jgi:hypothetical protein